jgi:hypothetical protein
MKDQEWVGLGGLIGTQLLRRALTKGANLPKPPAPAVKFTKADGNTHAVDTRVRITVPFDYYKSPVMTAGGNVDPEWSNDAVGVGAMKGIIFPYTPSIQYEHKATFASQNPAHSNFTQYFYQNSSVSPITISGKFTVENDTDAMFLLMTVHLLKSITKMQQGFDTNAGSPPPVCRLFGYGNYMLENVPVVITSFSHELPENVDYFTAYKNSNPPPPASVWFKDNSVPVVSSIKVVCNPIYSRQQIKDFSVNSWITGEYNARGQNKGYL